VGADQFSPHKDKGELDVAIVAFPFYLADATASQAGAAMSAAGEATAADVSQIPMPWACDVVGLSVQVEDVRTGGTLTLRPTNSAVATAQAVTIDGTNTQYNYVNWSKGYHLDVGDRLGCTWATDSSWAAGTTPSVHVTVFVLIEEVF